MARLTVGSQGGAPQGPQGPSSRLWWVAPICMVLAAVLVTLYVRFDGGGAFAVARGAVQTVTKPIESVCAAVVSPLSPSSSATDDDELAALEVENSQLRALVAELEEYRQQSERLTSLVALSDMYDLETVPAEVISTTSGWDRTATIDIGSSDGVRPGQGVISSCGLYGQVESVTSSTAVVRLVNDAESQTSARIQTTGERGIVKGSYDGALTLEYISVDSDVGVGDIVTTSGKGGVYPRGIVIGTVASMEVDSSMLYYTISIEPIYAISDCQEVLVLTGDESQTSGVVDEELLAEIVGEAEAAQAAEEAEAEAQAQAEADGDLDDYEVGSDDDGSDSDDGSDDDGDGDDGSGEGDGYE